MSNLQLLILGIVLYGLYWFNATPNKAIPDLPETWWGPGSAENADIGIKPFSISFSQKDIKDLRSRLANTRKLSPALQNSGWTYGVDGDYLPTVIRYWQDQYDFKERESHLNRFPQFITNIQGLDIHYIHVKPKNVPAGKRVLPLLIQHGWPGSVVEFHKIIPMLVTPRDEYDFVFEVVAPSLPGFGFSSSAIKPGLGSPQMAIVLKNLMLRIGFDQFYTQGGDWGAVTTANLAALFPQHVLGMHSNMCVVSSLRITLKTLLYSIAPTMLLPKEDVHLMYPLKEHWSNKLEESGYLHIQATKPDTVGVGPSDSPAALAAYALEKFSTATKVENRQKKDGGLLEKFTMDELIDNLMMYWIPNSMTTAMRIYAETFNKNNYALDIDSVPIVVPSACAQFPNEIFYQPASFLKHRFRNLLRATKMPRGGHFAALEEPELLADDIWQSVEEMEHFRLETAKKNIQENAIKEENIQESKLKEKTPSEKKINPKKVAEKNKDEKKSNAEKIKKKTTDEL